MAFERISAPLSLQVVGEAPPLATDVERRIDEIWKAERGRKGAVVFDGGLLGLRDRDRQNWYLETGSYRRFLGGLRDRGLAKAISFFPVGIAGLMHCRDGYVLGRRAPGLVQDAGLFEFIPAGGMEPADVFDGRADPIHALKREWHEESGGAPLDHDPEILGFIFDPETGVYDLILVAELDLSEEQLRQFHQNGDNREYSQIVTRELSDAYKLRFEMGKTSRELVEWLASRADL